MKFQLIFLTLLLLNTTKINSEEYEYDPNLSLDFLFYTKSSYCTQEQIETWSCICCPHNAKTTDAKVFQSTTQKTFGYTAYNPDQNLIIVAFRGSVNRQNFIDDADEYLEDYPFCEGCKVHRGFFRCWNSLQEQCIENLRELKEKYPTAKILSTGHSLGGSLSELGALGMVQAGFTVDYIYNYGTPRVGNPELAEYAHQVIPSEMRVVHYKDPAPHSPKESQGYRQFPTEVWYYSKENPLLYDVCYMPGAEEDPNCSDSITNTNFLNHFVYMQNDVGCNLRVVGDEETISNSEKFEYFQRNPYILLQNE